MSNRYPTHLSIWISRSGQSVGRDGAAETPALKQSNVKRLRNVTIMTD